MLTYTCGDRVELRHDATEAVGVGLWGVIEAGWLEGVPEAVRRR